MPNKQFFFIGDCSVFIQRLTSLIIANLCELTAESFVATETSSGGTWNFKDDSLQKELVQFHFNSSLNGFFQGAIVLVVPDRNGRYTRYNVISNLNDHVETNRGKTGKKKGGRWKDERVRDEQDKIAKLEKRGLKEDKEKESWGFIRVKIIGLPESLNKYRGKLNAANRERGRSSNTMRQKQGKKVQMIETN